MRKFGLMAVLALALACAPGVADAATHTHHHAKPQQPPQPPPTMDEIKAAMIGTWQDTHDPKFTRELDSNGTATDRYEGDDSATIPGLWVIFLGSNAPADFAGSNLDPNGVFFELGQNGDLQLFALMKADQASLEMVPMGQHKLLKFVRLK